MTKEYKIPTELLQALINLAIEAPVPYKASGPIFDHLKKVCAEQDLQEAPKAAPDAAK